MKRRQRTLQKSGNTKIKCQSHDTSVRLRAQTHTQTNMQTQTNETHNGDNCKDKDPTFCVKFVESIFQLFDALFERHACNV